MTRLTKKQREKMAVPSSSSSPADDDGGEFHDSSCDDSFHGEETTSFDKGISINNNSTEGKPRNGRMGSCITNRIGVFLTDANGDETFRTAPRLLDEYLIQLSDCKGKPRGDEALSVIVEALNREVKLEFVEKNYSTLLYQCLFCLTNRKGSAKRLLLSSRTVGLLGMIVEDEDYAHEIFEDSFPVFEQVLKSSSQKFKILDSLAIVAFFGANNVDETEKAMQIMWKLLNNVANSDSETKVRGKNSATAISAAIHAWSFLLSTIQGWRINPVYWQGAISYMSKLLAEEDECVYVAAAEALALIFETGCIEKFSELNDERKHLSEQELKENITEKLRCQAMKASKDVAKQKALKDVLRFFEASGKSLETYATIGEDELVLSMWSQRIQLNFVRSFLGEDGFVKHMKENEILQSVFEFRPAGDNSRGNKTVYSPERTEMTLRFYQRTDSSMLPFMSKEKKQILKKMTMSSNSYLNKARTRLLNKKRMLPQGDDYDD